LFYRWAVSDANAQSESVGPEILGPQNSGTGGRQAKKSCHQEIHRAAKPAGFTVSTGRLV